MRVIIRLCGCLASFVSAQACWLLHGSHQIQNGNWTYCEKCNTVFNNPKPGNYNPSCGD